MKRRCLGVLRERQNSPNRQTDDALILKAVLAELEDYGVASSLIAPEQLDVEDLPNWDLVIPMCESYARLKSMAAAAGNTLVINPPAAVLNCYRVRMVPLLADCASIAFPPSEIRRVEGGTVEPLSRRSPQGWWIKRGDVHNTCDRDVVNIREWSELNSVLRDFLAREITDYVIQPHIAGDLIKFYGVGPDAWFNWFYHDPNQVHGFVFDTSELAQAAATAATAIGLEIFGGDAIAGPDGRPVIIDINSWPSFAKVRGGAAPHIARHLHARLLNFINRSPLPLAGEGV